MLLKCRSSSISTVHFKRQLLSPPTVQFPTKTTTNALRRSDPSPHPSRLRAFMPPRELTHFLEALKIAAKMGLLCEAKQIHGHLLKSGLYQNLYLQSQIMSVYFKRDETCDARKVLDEMSDRNVVVWNTVICSVFYGKSSYSSGLSLGFSFFRTMLLGSARPDGITFNALLRLCLGSKGLEIGTQLHCFVAKAGFASHCFVAAALVDLYAKTGSVRDSRRAFDEVLYRDSVLWNVMVYCYSSNCFATEATRAFNLMRSEGFSGDEFTFTNLLSPFGDSGSCDIGKQIHGIVIRRGFDSDILVASVLVDMYSKGENLGAARKVFDTMAIRSLVSWNTLIVRYGRHGEGKEAIQLFTQMIREELRPDELTLASIISSCGNLGVNYELTQVHAYAIKTGLHSFLSANNGLVNAYSKCGGIACAFRCFSLASESDVFTWTSMISAYAFHGFTREATNCFEKMLTCGPRPDKITFLGVLCACSHGGLIDKGIEYFKIMTEKYQIVPDPEHYTCLVDLVGRSGLLDEAFAILNSIPTRESALGAFLGACKVHGNLRLAELAAFRVMTLEPNVAVNYTTMSNMYSSQGRWSDVASVRTLMRNNCDRKSPGFSWVDIGGVVHTFVSSDHSHPSSAEVYLVLGLLYRLIMEEYT